MHPKNKHGRSLLAALLVLTIGWFSISRRAVLRLPPHTDEHVLLRGDPRQNAPGTPATRDETGHHERLTYARRWSDPQPPALAEFRDWTERYMKAAAEVRGNIEAEGVRLARIRRPVFRDLIINDPEHALALAVPAAIRVRLPAPVRAELEVRVAGTGDVGWLMTSGATVTRRHVAYLNRDMYSVHIYGRRNTRMAKEGASLHGIAIDDELALHESPLRLLEPGEKAAGTASDKCAVTDEPIRTESVPDGEPIPDSRMAEAFGRAWEFCGAMSMVSHFEAQLIEHEDQPGPRIGAFPSAYSDRQAGVPATARAANDWSIGPKRLLVLRVDFSDFPGEPFTMDAVREAIDAQIAPFFDEVSYGATTLSGTLGSKVYRLPQTATAYAVNGNSLRLHDDAVAAARADFSIETFDRVAVVFRDIGPKAIPNSNFAWQGMAFLGGSKIWINDSTLVWPTWAHELGHTYGMEHANLWQVRDGNPLSFAGSTVEYGDVFDMMAGPTDFLTNSGRKDHRFHFNAYWKNRIGWLPDSAVATATTSGVYRIYRFDSKAARFDRPQALRIFRDGVQWYWIGLRQNFAQLSPTTNGAYVIWAYDDGKPTQLLDLTPGGNANDAMLAVGRTLSDPDYGIEIRAVGGGGTEPDQYLDIQVTVSSLINRVAGWGASSPSTAPSAAVRVKAVAAGLQHSLALKDDGSVIAWGDNSAGQAMVPAGLNDVITIAAGGNISGAVRRDGTVVIWGENAAAAMKPPAGLAQVQRLAIGRNYAVALRYDGSIAAWGDTSGGRGQITGNLAGSGLLAASDRTAFLLTGSGTLLSFGDGPASPSSRLTNVGAISAGPQHALALMRDGTVTAWGDNSSGQTTVPSGLSGVTAVAAGGNHSMALKNDGTIVVWGGNDSGQATAPSIQGRVYAIAAGGRHSLAIVPAVSIRTHPQDQTALIGSTVNLSVVVSGNGNLTYQWRKDGAVIPGATISTLVLPEATSADTGGFTVTVASGSAQVTSAPARVVVQPVSRISNLSIRTNAGTGAQTLIVGFVVSRAGANAQKPILIRGVGPTLGNFGVSTPLTDPRVELFDGSAVRQLENNDWNAKDTPVFSNVGAFPLEPGSRDAVIYSDGIAPGSYSVQVSGAPGNSGVVLAEIYDASDPTRFGVATPRLVNVSARAVSGVGADVLIAGFVVAGPAPKTVLIRGIGPTLAGFGVENTLNDPKLEVYDSGAKLVAQNDNWGGTAMLASAFASVGAFQLQAGSRDAAVRVTLPSGNYTAQVSGVGNSTGVVLVEVYEVP